MVELREDPNLVLDRRQRDQEQSKRQAAQRAQLPPGTRVSFSEIGEMTIIANEHPDSADLGTMTKDSAPIPGTVSANPTRSQTNSTVIQPAKEPPPDPSVALRNIRLSVLGLLVVILFILWTRQRSRN